MGSDQRGGRREIRERNKKTKNNDNGGGGSGGLAGGGIQAGLGFRGGTAAACWVCRVSLRGGLFGERRLAASFCCPGVEHGSSAKNLAGAVSRLWLAVGEGGWTPST